MGKLESPNQVGNKGNQGAAPDQKGGTLVSPAGSTNASEGNGHK